MLKGLKYVLFQVNIVYLKIYIYVHSWEFSWDALLVVAFLPLMRVAVSLRRSERITCQWFL